MIFRTKTGPLCQQVEVLYSKTVTRIAGQRDAALAFVHQEHVGLLPLWFKPYHIYHQMRIGLFLPPLVLFGDSYPLDPLANEPTSLHWRFGGLWVGRPSPKETEGWAPLLSGAWHICI